MPSRRLELAPTTQPDYEEAKSFLESISSGSAGATEPNTRERAAASGPTAKMGQKSQIGTGGRGRGCDVTGPV